MGARGNSGRQVRGNVRLHERGALDMRGSLLVPRPRLMERLAMNGEQAGVTFLCAPCSFGKTAILLERVMHVRAENGRGSARLIDARSLSAAEVRSQLMDCETDLARNSRPLIALDNMPDLSEEDARSIAAIVRRMRDAGFEFVIACAPYARTLMERMGDSAKLHAQALKVQTKEYAAWAEELSLSPAVDIYGLTQGVPSLVAALRDVTSRPDDSSSLAASATALYREVFREPASNPARTAMMAMIVLGEGSLSDLPLAGIRLGDEDIAYIVRDYPMFGIDNARRGFKCLDMPVSVFDRLRRDIADREPLLVSRCARVLMRAGRVDEVVALCERLLKRSEAAELIARHPVEFSLAGHTRFVQEVVGDALALGEGYAGAGLGLVLAAYIAGIVAGDYRTARPAALELVARADRIANEIDARTWECACACEAVWGGLRDLGLPRIRHAEGEEGSAQASALRLHIRLREAMSCFEAGELAFELRDSLAASSNAVDLSQVALMLDACLFPSFTGTDAGCTPDGERLMEVADVLEERGLARVAANVRMVRAAHELLATGRTDDARSFNEAGSAAVRRSDAPAQLFCMLAEGWQNLVEGQAVNARFRGQQALKLMRGEKGALREWAYLLERCAYVRNTSLVTLRADADALDLEGEEVTFAEAWATAIHLSAVRYDAELSYWYSQHKEVMLDRRFRAFARLALSCFAEERIALARLIPERRRAEFVPRARAETAPEARVSMGADRLGLGQVNISLFGGFRVEKNGYALTDRGWRRKKASTLAARLALCLGTYVPRSTVAEELWPQLDYRHAREGLYVTLSALRKVLGQRSEGPQYVLTQGEALALNPDFVSCDTARFDTLARDVLLRKPGLGAPQIIEACLSIEQLYKGELYVPDKGATAFFSKARASYLDRFADCMIAGCTLAIEEGQLPSASWLVKAALRHAPTREDVVRCAMRVLDLQGRRREIVELYNSHLHYLAQELSLYPERETRELYERIIAETKGREMM